MTRHQSLISILRVYAVALLILGSFTVAFLFVYDGRGKVDSAEAGELVLADAFVAGQWTALYVAFGGRAHTRRWLERGLRAYTGRYRPDSLHIAYLEREVRGD